MSNKCNIFKKKPRFFRDAHHSHSSYYECRKQCNCLLTAFRNHHCSECEFNQ